MFAFVSTKSIIQTGYTHIKIKVLFPKKKISFLHGENTFLNLLISLYIFDDKCIDYTPKCF